MSNNRLSPTSDEDDLNVPVRKPHRPLQLLIADDDDGFRETLRNLFEDGFETHEVGSGEEAIELAETLPVDLALVDMHMRRLTGLETVRILKRVHVATPCILITSDVNEQLRRDALAANAHEILAKPIRRRELLKSVTVALAERHVEIPDWLRNS
ncbi:response regulator [Thalassoroseus pseudoceratinae]|uniref:response regulator n=1 Tax=Thalassoroseus pseudoceratinae TaxID=2713176 RepID=UPI001422B317|nr:response regulator [Thalassoroseus pseudoceratinae]